MFEKFGICNEIEALANEVEKEIQPQFKQIDNICEINSLKVLQAMQNNQLSGMHLNTSTPIMMCSWTTRNKHVNFRTRTCSV